MSTDQQLLRAYAQDRSETAFAELVRQHVDFVYSAALRMVRDAQIAEDVTQKVFFALAQEAIKLADHPAPSGWLHRTTQNVAANFIRGDVRRRAREKESAVMNELLSNEQNPPWEEISQDLDRLLGELSEADRDALILRYFRHKSAQDIGLALGISAEAAQKRVNRAVDRLRGLFAQRGVTVGSSALAALISANSVQAAPLGLIGSITSLAGTATLTATQAIAMTTTQKILITTVLITAVGTGVYEASQASRLRTEIRSLRSQIAGEEQLQKLVQERDQAIAKVAALRDEFQKTNRNDGELLKLRGEVARLRAEARSAPRSKTENAVPASNEAAAKSWLARLDQLKQRLDQTPHARIPELELLTEEDWLEAVRDRELNSEEQYRRAFSKLRAIAEQKFTVMLQPALAKYLSANNREFPTDISQLQPYFDNGPVDDSMLQRYAIVPSSTIANVKLGGDWAVTQKAPVDEELDTRLVIGPHGRGSTGFKSPAAANRDVEMLTPVLKAYSVANNGREPVDPEELRRFITTPEQAAALQRLMEIKKASPTPSR